MLQNEGLLSIAREYSYGVEENLVIVLKILMKEEPQGTVNVCALPPPFVSLVVNHLHQNIWDRQLPFHFVPIFWKAQEQLFLPQTFTTGVNFLPKIRHARTSASFLFLPWIREWYNQSLFLTFIYERLKILSTFAKNLMWPNNIFPLLTQEVSLKKGWNRVLSSHIHLDVVRGACIFPKIWIHRQDYSLPSLSLRAKGVCFFLTLYLIKM